MDGDPIGSRTTRIRLGAVALASAGLLFVLYPAVRPWADESTVEGATQAMTSGAWVASHVFAMIGFILVGLGLLGLWATLRSTPAEPLAGAAVVTTWVGAGLTLPYYGGETFGLQAVATAAETQGVALLEVVEGFRFHPVAITTFGLGLVGLAVGAGAETSSSSEVPVPWAGEAPPVIPAAEGISRVLAWNSRAHATALRLLRDRPPHVESKPRTRRRPTSNHRQSRGRRASRPCGSPPCPPR